MKKALLIYNPCSGSGRIDCKLEAVTRQLPVLGISARMHPLRRENQEQFLPLLRSPDVDFIIVAGGDGTLNSVVNLLLPNRPELPIGIIPAGTSNDFARCLGLPSTPAECLEVLAAGKAQAVDVGLINGERYFLSTCAGGMFAAVSFSTSQQLKRLLGLYAYYLKAAGDAVSLKPFTLKIATEAAIIEEEALLFLLSNGPHAGGFSNLVADASLVDGLLDILLIKSCSRLELIRLLRTALNPCQSLLGGPVVRSKARSCTIESIPSLPTTIDGEEGPHLPLRIELKTGRLRVLIP